MKNPHIWLSVLIPGLIGISVLLVLFPALIKILAIAGGVVVVLILLDHVLVAANVDFYVEIRKQIERRLSGNQRQNNEFDHAASPTTLPKSLGKRNSPNLPPPVGKVGPATSQNAHPPTATQQNASLRKKQIPKATPSRVDDTPIGVFSVVDIKYKTRIIKDKELALFKKVGGGGEAEVVIDDLGNACKVFREPEDPYYDGEDMKGDRAVAIERMRAYPWKLPQFPPWLGSRVIAPAGLIYREGSKYKVSGYTMKLVTDSVPMTKYLHPRWKRTNKVTTSMIGRLFLDLYDTVQELHGCGMLIGDFKPANILVSNGKCYVVDAESASLGEYPCRTFTEQYLDPRICNPKLDYPVLYHPYDRNADWYSYTVILFKVLTNLNPYDGSYTPEKGEKPILPSQRGLKRISVFNKNVIVPNFTESIKTLPQGLQDLFFQVFEIGFRGTISRELIESLITDNQEIPQFVPSENTCWGKFKVDSSSPVKCSNIDVDVLKIPDGELYAFDVYGKELLTLSCSEGHFLREDGRIVFQGDVDGFNFFHIGKGFTVIGKDLENVGDPNDSKNRLIETFDGPFYIVPDKAQANVIKHVDPSYDGKPNLVIQNNLVFWVFHGTLHSLNVKTQEKRSLLKFPGNVKLFSGKRYGLAFTTLEGELADIYIYKKRSVNRLISLPPIMGNVSKIQCVFSQKGAWVIVGSIWEGVETDYLLVLDLTGKLTCMGHLPSGEVPWMSEDIQLVAFDEKVPDVKNTFVPKLACFFQGRFVQFTANDQKITMEKEGVANVADFVGVMNVKDAFYGLKRFTESTLAEPEIDEDETSSVNDDLEKPVADTL